MSMLVTGVDAPNYCSECSFHSNSQDAARTEYRCEILGRIVGSKPHDCPIYPVFDESDRPEGQWKMWGGMDIPENHGRHRCSLCGEFAPEWRERRNSPIVKERLTRFCPNCGAKMEWKD